MIFFLEKSTKTAVISSTPTTRKPNMENIQLAECIGNVRALLIGIFCDNIFKDICSEEGDLVKMLKFDIKA